MCWLWGELVTMSIASIGSISDRVYRLIDNIPTSISGTELNNIVQDQITFAEQYTGLSIGTTISERFQPAIVALSCGATQRFVDAQGSDRGFSLSELSVNASTSNSSTADAFTKDGMEKLKRIGRKFAVYKAFGW